MNKTVSAVWKLEIEICLGFWICHLGFEVYHRCALSAERQKGEDY